jgi:hypothetical protein
VERLYPDISVPPERFLLRVMEGFRAYLQCSLHSQRELSMRGATAWEFILESCQRATVRSVKLRTITAGDWLYQVTVLASSRSLADSDDATRFMESFRITTP